MAEVTKILSPQIAGVELPTPGNCFFQITLLVSENFDGKFTCFEIPLPFGPLHAGQFSEYTLADSVSIINEENIKAFMIYNLCSVEKRFNLI